MSPVAEPRLRAGVVGAGHMGQYHILALMELWDVDLVGIVDVDFARAQHLATTYGTRAFRDYRELAGLVDVATVAVPTLVMNGGKTDARLSQAARAVAAAVPGAQHRELPGQDHNVSPAVLAPALLEFCR